MQFGQRLIRFDFESQGWKLGVQDGWRQTLALLSGMFGFRFPRCCLSDGGIDHLSGAWPTVNYVVQALRRKNSSILLG